MENLIWFSSYCKINKQTSSMFNVYLKKNKFFNSNTFSGLKTINSKGIKWFSKTWNFAVMVINFKIMKSTKQNTIGDE
jgi:hypothetical protein